MALCKNLRQYREEKRLSQEEVAQQLNISRQTISRWETGKRCPDIDSLIELSNIYKVSLDILLKDEKVLHKKNSDFELDDKSQLYTILGTFSIVAPLGIIIAIALLIINKKHKKKYKIVTLICVVSIIVNIIKMLFNGFLLLNRMEHFMDFI